MYVVMRYFVFMEGTVSSLIQGENISLVWNLLFLILFWRLVGKGEDGPCGGTLMQNPMMPLCCISFLCVL